MRKEFITANQWREKTEEHQIQMAALTKEIMERDRTYWQSLTRKQQAQGGRFPIRAGFPSTTAKRGAIGPGMSDSRQFIDKHFPQPGFRASGEIRFRAPEKLAA